jgi:hypothetical protein
MVGRPVIPAQRAPSPLEWVRSRREDRASRKAGAKRARVERRVELLGPQWRVLDLDPEDPDFIAIGPGGIFQVTVCDHGRSKVLLAGDVVQIDGHRPPYVAQARREASRISAALSAAAGRRIPVVPMVAFLGSGAVVYYGRPPEGCVVTTYQDIRRALNAHGSRLSQSTIDKVCALADHPDTWTNHLNEDASPYRWYPEGSGTADKKRDRR